jgi:hypothetical protein
MNGIFVFFVIVVAALILWLRFRSKIAPENADQLWWFTLLKPKNTDPDTPKYNLPRMIEAVYAQWISSDITSILDTNDTAISTSKVAPDVKAWKAQRRDERFVSWPNPNLVTFNPILIIVGNGVDRNHSCRQSACHQYVCRFVSNTGRIKYDFLDGFNGLRCLPTGHETTQ